MSEIETFYDSKAEEEWARLAFERDPKSWLEFQVAMHLFEKYLPPVLSSLDSLTVNSAEGPAPVRVLDVGGGPGRYTVALAEKGYCVTLFDLSQESLSLARQNVCQAGVVDQVEGYEHGSATDLSRFADECFDVVLVMGPLYHLVDEADRLAVVQESLRVLRTDGIVVAAIINHLGVARAGVTEFPEWYEDTYDCLNIIRSYTQIIEGDHPFTTAYFAHPLELRGWYERAGAETISMAAQEGVAGGLREGCRQLAENPVAWQNFVRVVLETCEDPTILGGSEHTLYVGRKRGSK